MTSRRSQSTKTLLRAAWRIDPPSRFLDYKDFLRSMQREVEAKAGARYPFHQLSQDLGFGSQNAVYIIIHGYRKMNAEQVEQVVAALGLTGSERRYFLRLVAYTDCAESERRAHFDALAAERGKTLDDDHDKLLLRFFGEWHHAAVFEMIGLAEFRSDPTWIAERFYPRITPEQVKKSLDLLESLGLVRFDDTAQRHVKLQKSVGTGDQVRGMAIVGYHLQMLELSQAALSSVAAEEREIGALTLAVSEDVARRLREDVRLFRKYAVYLSEQCDNPDRIMQINLQLFPVVRSAT